jgi:hypothetical protein
MKQLYLFIWLIICSVRGITQSVEPPLNLCLSNMEVYAQSNVCGAKLGEVQKPQVVLKLAGVKFILEGATVGTYTGSINNRFFNIGRTRVTYPEIHCSFFVTVLGKKVLIPDNSTLPYLRICIGADVPQPTGRYSCNKDEKVGAYLEDSTVLKKPGKGIKLTWLYGDRKTPDTIQRQVIDITDVNWRFAVDTLPVITGECFAAPGKAPIMKNDCNESIVEGKISNKIDFNQVGTSEIIWRFYFGDKYREQKQLVIISERKGIRKLRKNIDTIVEGCSITLQKPLAAVGCEGNEKIIEASTIDPIRLTTFGEHTIKWTFYYGRDTAEQFQKVTIKSKQISLTRQSLDTVIAGCFYEVKDVPRAITCTGRLVDGRALSPLKLVEPGDHLIRWMYASGSDTIYQNQLIELTGDKRILPSLTKLPDIVGNCKVTITEIPTATYGCNKLKVTGKPDQPLTYDKPGIYTITWRYIAGEASFTQDQRVEVKSAAQLVPQAISLPTITGSCSVSRPSVPTAKNTCTGKIIEASTTSPDLFDKPGEYNITWTFTDDYAETITQIQSIIVTPSGQLTALQNTLPVLRSLCSMKVIDIPQAQDPCNGKIITASTDDPLNYDLPGEYTITWNYKLDGQTLLRQTQIIVIEPGQRLKPEKPVLPTISGDCKVTITEIPTATYGCNQLKVTGKPDQPLTYDKPGIYTITWRYIANDTSFTQDQRVEVKSAAQLVPQTNSLPTITGSCSVSRPSVPTAKNTCTGKIIEASTTSPDLFDKPGEYNITWTFTDDYAETITQTQSIIVTPSGQLTALQNSLPVLRSLCSMKVTDIPRAQDPCNGKIIAASTDDPLNYNLPGEYTITWNYKVDGQILLKQTQMLVIEPGQRLKPEKPVLPSIIGNCLTVVNEFPNAINSCTGAVIRGTTNDALFYNIPGEYIIHWTFREQNYNFTQTQTVIVKGGEKLIFDQDKLPDIVGNCMVTIKTIPFARTGCSRSMIWGKTNDPLNYSKPGTYTVNWIFKDGSIETIRQQRVIVADLPEKFKIYPNPTKNEFRIMVVGCNLPEKIGLKIFDVLGKLLAVKEIDPNQEVVFGSAYQSGTYILHVTQGTKTSVHKIIKVK